jgi:hypothetical protein
LTPTFTLSTGANSDPASGTEGDYSSEVTITVTAEDGTTKQDWKVNVSEASNIETDILSFVLDEQTGPAVINDTIHTVAVEVENGTDLTALTPTFTLSEGATSDPESGTSGDYSSEVTITVTAEDGVTVQDWTVNVTEASATLRDSTDILSFTIPEQISEAVIDDVNHTISVEVDQGIADLTNLVPTFTLSSGATSVPESGIPGDYTSTVTITVTAEDGITVQDWSVNVTEVVVGPSSSTNILFFKLAEQTSLAVIDYTNHTVAIEVVNGTDLTSLTPAFLLSYGATSVPESETTGDYSNEVVITVTAEDGVTVQDWNVNVTEASAGLSSQTDIIYFNIPEQTMEPVIDGVNHMITVEVLAGTNLMELTPNWTLSPGATSVPTSGTTGDYGSTNPIITVTAEDGVTTQDWVVDVYHQESNPTNFCDMNACGTDEAKREMCESIFQLCIYRSSDIDRDQCIIESLIICSY